MTRPADTTETYLPFGTAAQNRPAPRPADANPALTPQDLFLFNEGSHLRLYDKLGSAPGDERDGKCPATTSACGHRTRITSSVVGDFNGWDKGRRPGCGPIGSSSGVWAGFIPGVAEPGRCYKYHVAAPGGFTAEKTDPFAFHLRECRRSTAAVTWDLGVPVERRRSG